MNDEESPLLELGATRGFFLLGLKLVLLESSVVKHSERTEVSRMSGEDEVRLLPSFGINDPRVNREIAFLAHSRYYLDATSAQQTRCWVLIGAYVHSFSKALSKQRETSYCKILGMEKFSAFRVCQGFVLA